MRHFLASLPPAIRYLLYVLLAILGLVGLIVLFEYAGGILDTGGVVGP